MTELLFTNLIVSIKVVSVKVRFLLILVVVHSLLQYDIFVKYEFFVAAVLPHTKEDSRLTSSAYVIFTFSFF